MSENTSNTICLFFICLLICFFLATIRGCVEQENINQFNLKKSAFENGYDIVNDKIYIKRHEKEEDKKE